MLPDFLYKTVESTTGQFWCDIVTIDCVQHSGQGHITGTMAK